MTDTSIKIKGESKQTQKWKRISTWEIFWKNSEVRIGRLKENKYNKYGYKREGGGKI